MKHALAAMILLAVAPQAQARILDNFLESDLEARFGANLIGELLRQDLSISETMVGGAFQFRKDFRTDTVDITVHGVNKDRETLYSIPLYETGTGIHGISCHFYFYQKDVEKPRAAFLKGDAFLIEKLDDSKRTEAGELSYYFSLSECERTLEGNQISSNAYRKTFIICVSKGRLNQALLIRGCNQYIYPLMSKEDKDLIARAPLPDFRFFDSESWRRGPENLMGCLVASPWSAWRVGVEAEGKSSEVAIAKYTEGIQSNPKDAWSHWKRANAYRKKKDFPSAIRDLGEVIKLAEAQTDAGAFVIEMLNTRAIWRIEDADDFAGGYADANEVIRRAQAAGGDVAKRWEGSGYANRGVANRGRGEFNQSLKDHDKAIALADGKDAGPYLVRGQTYACMKDYDSAIRDFTEAIHIDSQLAAAYYERAECYGRKQDFEAGLRDINRAIELDGKRSSSYTRRAALLEALGRTSEAAADRRKAKDLE